MTYSKRTKLYIAGPYNGEDAVQMIRNIRHGLKLNAQLRIAGFLTYCPWSDFLEALFLPDFEGRDWRKDAIEELISCDGLVLADRNPGWQESQGTIDELATCAYYDIPVFLESRIWELDKFGFATLLDDGNPEHAVRFERHHYEPGDQEDDGEVD